MPGWPFLRSANPASLNSNFERAISRFFTFVANPIKRRCSPERTKKKSQEEIKGDDAVGGYTPKTIPSRNNLMRKKESSKMVRFFDFYL